MSRAFMRDLAEFFSALADQARLQILWLLAEHGELCVCDLTQALGITQSKASRHLATLRHAGLVTDRRQGPWSYYSLRQPASAVPRATLAVLRRGLTDRAEARRVQRRLLAWLRRKAAASCPVRGGRRSRPSPASRPAARPGRPKGHR